jgi:hypothetical protein
MVTGAGLSLRNLKRNWTDSGISGGTLLRASLPMGLFQVLVTVLMLFFFTN